METKKVKGLTVKFRKDKMTIVDSYQIKNIDKMIDIINESLEKTDDYESNRTLQSFLNEWITHNNFYKFHLFVKHTKDTDFESEQTKIISFLYNLFSIPNRCLYKLSKKNIKYQINKKRKQYNKYIKDHQANVYTAYYELKAHNVFDEQLMQRLLERVMVHDESKYSEEEFEPYRKNFFPISQQEKEENKEDFEKAWEHHWKNNPHHWQYRQDKEFFNIDNENDVLNVLENVLDWMAMGYQFNDRPYQYYENNKNHIFLCEDEKNYLEHVIYDIVDKDYINKGE